MKSVVMVIGGILLLLGASLPVEAIVSRGLPLEYAEYAENYLKGLNLFRWLLMGGALYLILARRHVEGIFASEKNECLVKAHPASRGERWAIGLITLAGLLLCLIGYTQGFTFDEVFLVNAILTENPIKMFVHPSGSAHVLNSLPANLLVHVFGASEAICRLPALLASVLTPLALWTFVRRVSSVKVALVSALLLCIAPIHVWYAQEAKGNAWLMLLVPVSWYLLSRLAERWQSHLAIAYWLSLFLISLSHLSGIMFIIATIPVFLLPQAWRPCGLTRQSAGRLTTLHLLAAWAALMFYSPIIPFMLDFSSIAHVNEGTASLFPLCRDILQQFTALDLPGGYVAMCGIAALVGLMTLAQQNRGILCLFVVPFVIDLGITIGCQLFSFPRYHMYAFPWLMFLLALGACRLKGPNLGVVVVVICLGASLLGYYSQPKSNLKALAAIIQQQPVGAVIYVVGGNKKSYPTSGLMYYTDRFETDDTIAERLETLSDDAMIDLFVIDALQFKTARAALADVVTKRGTRMETLQCLAELDQFRVRESYWFRIQAAPLKEWLASQELKSEVMTP